MLVTDQCELAMAIAKHSLDARPAAPEPPHATVAPARRIVLLSVEDAVASESAACSIQELT